MICPKCRTPLKPNGNYVLTCPKCGEEYLAVDWELVRPFEYQTIKAPCIRV